MRVSESGKLATGTIIRWHNNIVNQFIVTYDEENKIDFQIGEHTYQYTKSIMYDWYICPKHTFLTRYKIL